MNRIRISTNGIIPKMRMRGTISMKMMTRRTTFICRGKCHLTCRPSVLRSALETMRLVKSSPIRKPSIPGGTEVGSWRCLRHRILIMWRREVHQSGRQWPLLLTKTTERTRRLMMAGTGTGMYWNRMIALIHATGVVEGFIPLAARCRCRCRCLAGPPL